MSRNSRSLGLAALFCALGLVGLDTTELRGAERPSPQGPANFGERQEAWDRHQALAADSLFHGLEWRCVGPVIQGGRVVDIEGIPGQPYSFYVAYASGGLWRTTNNGHTFEPLFDDQPAIIMGDLAIDPSNPNTLWVGTGENNSSRSSYGGFGVFRSQDAGKTWTHMGLGETDRIGRVLVDPRDSNRVFVASLGKLYTQGGQRGVYRTQDGGKTWEAVLEGKGWTGAIDLCFDPSNPDILYAATWERSRRPWDFVESGEGSGVWKSTDGGSTWTRLTNGLPQGPDVGRIGLTICQSQPKTLYISIDNQQLLDPSEWDLGGAVSAKRLRTMSKEEFLAQDPDVIEGFIRSSDLDTTLDAKQLIRMIENDELTLQDLLAEIDDANASLFETDIRGLEVYRSDDAGGTWRRTHEDPLLQIVHTYGYYFGLIRVAPNDPNTVFIAGVPLVRSRDGGVTWHGVNQPDVHVDHHALWFDPNFPERIILGNDGGIDESFDLGETWRKMDRQPVGQFYTIAVDMAKPYNIYGGTQDNGTLKGSSRSKVGIDEWEFIGGGDGMHVQIDSRDNTVYFGYQFGFYTHRGPAGTHSVRPRDALGDPALRYNWSTPVRLSLHNEDIVYFGTNILFRSMDQGKNWTAISPDLTRSEMRGNVPFACITSVSESPLEFGVIWAGTDDGYVHVTETGGVSWRAADDGIVRDRWVTRVAASAFERDRAYLCLSGYRDDDIASYVYVTEDLGKTWKSIAAGLPAEPVNVITEDPVNQDVLYVGTDRGVYVSIDRGKTWQSLAEGMPKVPVHDLVVHPRDRELVAGTHGRSVFVIDALPIQELSAEALGEPVTIYPVEDIKFSRWWRSERSRWFYDPENDPKLEVPFWCSSGGQATLEVLDADDRVLRRMELDVKRGVNRFTWDLLLDPALALDAEVKREEERKADSDDPEGDDKGRLARTPWAEARRLNYPLYVTPGKYTLRITQGDEASEISWTVDEPSKRQPRAEKKPKIRGQKDDD